MRLSWNETLPKYIKNTLKAINDILDVSIKRLKRLNFSQYKVYVDKVPTRYDIIFCNKAKVSEKFRSPYFLLLRSSILPF